MEEESGNLLQEMLNIPHNASEICNEESALISKVEGVFYCPVDFDSVTCWPASPVGELAYRPCPIWQLTDKANSSRMCYENGTWATQINYNACVNTAQNTHADNVLDIPSVRVIIVVGYSISSVALLLALAIFCYFRSLRCLRNVIHCNLILAFILRNVVHILFHFTADLSRRASIDWLCKAKTTLLQYSSTTTFFWMFVEGVYLFYMVVRAFSANKIKFWHYACVGWGVPAVMVLLWVIVKTTLQENDTVCWLPKADNAHYSDYILEIPICLVLLCNVVFLTVIIWVLLTKLRASNSLETRQFRKATRAILVLFPLLGLTYLLLFYEPRTKDDVYSAFKYTNAILTSIQGLVIAVFYCFLNGEVQTLLRKKLSSIQDSRGLFTRHTKSSFAGSPGRSSFHALSLTTCNGRQSLNGDDGKDKYDILNTTTTCTEVDLGTRRGYSQEDEEAARML